MGRERRRLGERERERERKRERKSFFCASLRATSTVIYWGKKKKQKGTYPRSIKCFTNITKQEQLNST